MVSRRLRHRAGQEKVSKALGVAVQRAPQMRTVVKVSFHSCLTPKQGDIAKEKQLMEDGRRKAARDMPWQQPLSVLQILSRYAHLGLVALTPRVSLLIIHTRNYAKRISGLI